MEPLLGATSEAYDNSVAVQLHRYGDSTAIPEALDSHAAPLWITDTPNRSHTASEATPSALTLLPRARLYTALAVFMAVATLYATTVLSTHWFRPHRRSEQILASLQAAPVVAALAAEGLLQSGMLPSAKHCNGQLGRLAASPLRIVVLSTAAILISTLWPNNHPPRLQLSGELILISGAQAVAAAAWAASLWWAARRIPPAARPEDGGGGSGGRQMQTSWRAMESLERWQLPREQFDSIVVAGTVEAALAREGEARALAQAVQLRRESEQAWQQLRERQEALQRLEIVQKASAAENMRLRASLQEWSLANARLERQLRDSLKKAPL